MVENVEDKLHVALQLFGRKMNELFRNFPKTLHVKKPCYFNKKLQALLIYIGV